MDDSDFWFGRFCCARLVKRVVINGRLCNAKWTIFASANGRFLQKKWTISECCFWMRKKKWHGPELQIAFAKNITVTPDAWYSIVRDRPRFGGRCDSCMMVVHAWWRPCGVVWRCASRAFQNSSENFMAFHQISRGPWSQLKIRAWSWKFRKMHNSMRSFDESAHPAGRSSRSVDSTIAGASAEIEVRTTLNTKTTRPQKYIPIWGYICEATSYRNNFWKRPQKITWAKSSKIADDHGRSSTRRRPNY